MLIALWRPDSDFDHPLMPESLMLLASILKPAANVTEISFAA